MKPIKLDCKFQAHIILYCKGHYHQEDVDFITGLQRIWAVRCGHGVEHICKSSLEYIADDMYRVMQKTLPKKIERMHEIIHKGLCERSFFRNDDEKSAIEKLILIYKSELMMLQIRDKIDDKYVTLIKLPTPQKRLFNRIVKGKGEFNDYEKIKG